MKNLSPASFDEYFNDFFTPHSEGLRFLAEEGIIASCLMFLFFASFLFPVQKLKILADKCPESMAFFIFFASQFLFQFPLIQPIPLFFTPFVLAYTAHYTNTLLPLMLPYPNWIFKMLGAYFFLFFLGMSISLLITRYYFFDININKIFYQLWKDRQIARQILLISYANKDLKNTKKYVTEMLQREPQDLEAIKYLGFSLLKEGEKTVGCEYLKFYDNSFPQPPSDHAEIQSSCSSK